MVGNLLDLSRIEGGSLANKTWTTWAYCPTTCSIACALSTAQHHVTVDVGRPAAALARSAEIGEVLSQSGGERARYAPPARKSPSRCASTVCRARPGFRSWTGIPSPRMAHLDPFYRAIDGERQAARIGARPGHRERARRSAWRTGMGRKSRRGGARFTFTTLTARNERQVARKRYSKSNERDPRESGGYPHRQNHHHVAFMELRSRPPSTVTLTDGRRRHYAVTKAPSRARRAA